jgi:hypothetical protein
MVEATINAADGDAKPVSNNGGGATPELPRRDPEPARIAGFETVSPDELRFESSEPSRRRGRPRGSKNRDIDKAAPTGNLIESLESLLLSVHFMGAKLLDAPEWELDPQEAKMFADSVKKVAEFYPVGLSPKRLAMAEFSIVVATIYGPRIVTTIKKAPRAAVTSRVASGPQAVPQRQQTAQQAKTAGNGTSAATAPRVPSEMWNQDGIELPSDQA